MSGYGQFTDSLEYQSGNPSLKATTTHSVMLNLTFFSSLTGTTARYMNYRREKWIPTADWYMIYRVAPIAMDCVLSYGIIGSSSITPQSRYWELRDGFGLALQKNFLNNRLKLSVLWSPDIHFMPGKTHTYRYSPALNTVGWSDANFRSNNMINFYIAYRLARGKKVRNYKHQTHTVE